jgi:hypothetical protein
LQPIVIQKPQVPEIEDDYSGVYGPENFNWKCSRFSNISLFKLNAIRLIIFLFNFLIFGSSIAIGDLRW